MGEHMENQKQIYLTPDKLCRTCMYSGTDVISLFDVIDIGERKETLSSILVKCTSIQVTRNDIFPQQICQICLKKLLEAFLFREDCHRTHQKFEDLFNSQTTIYCDNVLDIISHDTGNDSLKKNDYIPNHELIPEAIDRNIQSIEECESKTQPKKHNDISDYDSCVETEHNVTEETEFVESDFKYVCSKCNKTFWTESSWKAHEDTHIKRKLTEAADVKRHMSVHTGLKPYSCAICHTSFTQSGSLATHMKKHEEFRGLEGSKKTTEQTPYLCPYCGKAFKHSSSLTTHLRTHSEDKPYFCMQCGMRFVSNGKLTSHMRTHTGERPYVCKYCGSSFSQSTTLKKHIRSHMGTKDYKCQQCNKSFATSYYLNIHKRKHTGEQPLKCNICARAFSDPKNLKQHKMIHSGDRPYHCLTCGKAFRRSHHLKAHMSCHLKQSQVSDTKFKKSVLTFLHRITKQISDLEKQLDSLSVQQCQHNFKGEVDQNKEEYENVYQQLPIESEEALRGIEKKLDDSQLSTYLVGCLQKIGGTNYKEATRRISKRVISDKVAVHYSLKGHKSKQPFMNLKICALIIEAVQSCIKDTVSSKEIELALGVYLAKASERLKKNTEGATIFFLVHMWTDNLKTPTIVNQSGSNVPIQKVYFPAIGICSINKISKKKAVEYAQEINSYRKLDDIDSVLQDIVTLGQLYTFKSETEGSFIRLEKWMDKYDNYTEGYDISRRLLQLSPSCEDMLQSCRWAGEKRDCSKLFTRRITYDGFCCTFNYVRPFTNSKIYTDTGKKLQVEVKEPKTPIGAGAINGLSIALKNDLEDYFYTSLETTGYKVLLFNPADYPDKISGSLNEIIVGFNKEVLIGLRVDVCQGSSALRQLPLSLRKCMFTTDSHTSFGLYSHSDCLVDCKAQSIISLCQCIPFTIPVESDEIDACSLIDLPCLSRYVGKWAKYHPKDMENEELMIQEKHDSMHCSHCLPSCTHSVYKPYTSIANVLDNQNITYVHIFFDENFSNIYKIILLICLYLTDLYVIHKPFILCI
ncbi:unnamed protein product [Callosobruchus maculatus]|uniref:Protein krueppel n=1 Tax=Callosobruchus maculatus TaxID=64391 RepID=A0A653BMN0_CALMS|nr:unnamed protein product [Callosobruchus maculatus]